MGAQPLPRRHYTVLTDNHLLSFYAASFGIILTVWLRHGGFGNLGKGAVLASTSLTQLTGIMASFAGLAGLTLAARPVSIEHRYGLDRVFIWHRMLGETMAVLIGVHIVTSVSRGASTSALAPRLSTSPDASRTWHWRSSDR